MTHRFSAGQSVRFARGRSRQTSSAGVYKIVRQLPESGTDPQYRIKGMHEAHERVVNESELERVA
jgi:hypothetical protein